MPALFPRLISDTSGAAIIEYGMIVALIAAVIIGVVEISGANINATFGIIKGQLGSSGV